MTSLYYPPNFASLLPGSKLFFYITGTTSPQNTYTDEALTVANANPVVADANGLFPVIYMDPRSPSYRVRWETAAGVSLYQRDGYPSNQNIGGIFRLESITPTLIWYQTNAGADQRKMSARLTADGLRFFKLNDAETVETLVKTILWEGEIIRSKVADAPRTNNTVTIDPDLQYTFDFNVGALYEFDAFLVFKCASTTPGTSFQFATSAGTCRYAANGSADAATAAADYLNFATTSNSSVGWAWTNAARHIAHVKGYISAPTNGATFALYWAQTTTNATAMILETGSFMRVRQVRL